MAALIAGFLVGAALAAAVCLYRARRPKQPPTQDPRVAELAELAGGLAHELRNPLSTIMVNLQLLAEDLRDENQTEADVRRRALLKVEAVGHEAERLRHLLDDFLRMAGPCRLERKRVDLNRLVEHLVEFFSPQASAADVRLRLDCAEGSLECFLDEHLIEQALLNLLINAQQAMASGGEVIIRTWQDGERTAAVEVSDTGPGLSREEQAKVFKPFYSTKVGGTGLGLSTTQRIVAEHGGELDLHSEPGRGTCFTIRLPLAPRPK